METEEVIVDVQPGGRFTFSDGVPPPEALVPPKEGKATLGDIKKETPAPSGKPGKGKAQKSQTSPIGRCKFDQAGHCKKGAACKFIHAKPSGAIIEAHVGDENPVVATTGRVSKPGMKVYLDVSLRDHELASVQEAFPEVTVINGTGKVFHVHREARAVRTIMEKVAKSLNKRPVLCFQGKDRDFYQEAPDDTCRRYYTSADEGEEAELCDNRDGNSCVHEAKLLAGEYKVLFLMDVPLAPDDIRALFDAYPHVQEIFSALHVYSDMRGTSAEQSYVWVPTDEPRMGSIGEYQVTCSGTDVINEPDHYWLTAQYPMCGVKPELIARIDHYSYSVFRFVRRKELSRPVANINARNFLKMRTPVQPAHVAGMDAYKFSRNFAVFDYQGMKLPVRCDEVLNELDQLVGRDTTLAARVRLANRYSRDKFDTDQEVLDAVVCEIKRVQERPFLEAEYRPLKRARCCFNWASSSRRSIDQLHSSMRAGTEVLGMAWGAWALIKTAIFAMLGAIPYPNFWWDSVSREVESPWLSWTPAVWSTSWFNFSIGVPAVNIWNVRTEFVELRWSLTYVMWHVPIRVLVWGAGVVIAGVVRTRDFDVSRGNLVCMRSAVPNSMGGRVAIECRVFIWSCRIRQSTQIGPPGRGLWLSGRKSHS